MGPQTLVRIVEVSVIGGVHFRRFHCIHTVSNDRCGGGRGYERASHKQDCNYAEFNITCGRRPFSVHFIRTADRNTTCSVSVADQSTRVYCVVFEVVALV